MVFRILNVEEKNWLKKHHYKIYELDIMMMLKFN